MKVYLSKSQLLETVSEEEATVYIALKMLYDGMLTQGKESVQAYVNAQILYWELSGSLDVNRTTKVKIEEGINGLCEAEIIEIKSNDNHGNYIIELCNLAIDTAHEAYVAMEQEEIRTIFNIPFKQRFNLLRFAVNTFGTINTKQKCGYSTFTTLQAISGIGSKTTCVQMMKLLEEYKILYVRHSDKSKRDMNGEIKNLPNCYGRPSDKEFVDKFYMNRRRRQGFDFTNTMSSARKAKITRNYNKYIDGTYKGDIIELIRECMTFNKIPYNELNPEYKKDMDVFSAEDIEKAENGLTEHIRAAKKEEKEKEKSKDKKEKSFFGGMTQMYNFKDCAFDFDEEDEDDPFDFS